MNVNQPKGDSVAPDHKSSAPVDGGDNSSVDNSQNKPSSDPDKERAIQDMLKFKTRSRELEQKVSDLTKQIENKNRAELQAKEDYKTIAENAQKELEQYKAKHESFVKGSIENEKRNAVRTAAIKAGLINEGDVELISVDDIEVEVTTSGRMLVHGADALVEAQKKLRPHWFKNTQPPTVNTGGGRGGSGGSDVVNATDLYEIEKKHGRTSKEYVTAFNKFRDSKLKPNK